MRITAQLIDATTGVHLWADRFDGRLEDVFDLQDHVTASVVGAIAPKLEQAETERAKRKPTENLNAYDCFLRGMAGWHRFTRDANREALRLFYRAIDLDPDFAAAYGMAARCYQQRHGNRWMIDRAQEIPEAVRLVRQAIESGRDDAVALWSGGVSSIVSAEIPGPVSFSSIGHGRSIPIWRQRGKEAGGRGFVLAIQRWRSHTLRTPCASVQSIR